MRYFRLCTATLFVLGLGFLLEPVTHAAQLQAITPSEVEIPLIDEAPRLEDFLTMRPTSRTARQMAHVGDFVQRDPSDGDPANNPTEVYLGYDSNAQNYDRDFTLVPGGNPGDDPSIFRPRRSYINDARQFFVKFSYLVRF